VRRRRSAPPILGKRRVVSFRAVIFDWRGTLVSVLSNAAWVRESLVLLGREARPDAVHGILSAILQANGPQNRLDAPGIDTSADLHRRTFMAVLDDAGLDESQAAALYAVKSDPRHNPFAEDVLLTLTTLHRAGSKLAVVSDIHFDLRPAFAAAGLHELIDVFTLSFEQGVQKPDPLMFTRTLDALDVHPPEVLMVGDRSHPDGAAVE